MEALLLDEEDDEPTKVGPSRVPRISYGDGDVDAEACTALNLLVDTTAFDPKAAPAAPPVARAAPPAASNDFRARLNTHVMEDDEPAAPRPIFPETSQNDGATRPIPPETLRRVLARQATRPSEQPPAPVATRSDSSITSSGVRMVTPGTPLAPTLPRRSAAGVVFLGTFAVCIAACAAVAVLRPDVVASALAWLQRLV